MEAGEMSVEPPAKSESHIHPTDVDTDKAVRHLIQYLRKQPALAATAFSDAGVLVLVDAAGMFEKVKADNPGADFEVLFATFMSVYLYAVMHEFCHVVRPQDNEEQVHANAKRILERLTGGELVDV
jgi:hypothetical protein